MVETMGHAGRPRAHILGLLLIVALGLALLASPSPSRAADSPFEIEFDRSEMKIGPLDSMSLGQASTPASIEGIIDESGKVTVPKNGFRFPRLGLEGPVRVSAFMALEDDATGTFDRETGALELNTKVGIWLSVNLRELTTALSAMGIDLGEQLGPLSGFIGAVGDLTCGFAPMDVTFTTGSTSLGRGAPFAEGPLGPGAITGEWSQLGPFAGRTKVPILNLDLCLALRAAAPSLISGGLDGSTAGALGLSFLLDNLDHLNLGPSSLTLTRTRDEHLPTPVADPPAVAPPTADPPPAEGSPNLRLTVTPKKPRTKRGRRVVFTAKVKNHGGRDAEQVRVCLAGPGAGLLVRRRCRAFGTVRAGKAKVRRFRLRVRRKASRPSARFRFRLKASGLSGQTAGSRLRIRR